jgi:putative tricarboxylic transport membrane protein
MIPLLALGLPGGALTAIMLAAFQMHGIEAGPLVLMTSKDLVWTVFAAMLLANLSIILLGYVETRSIVHLLRIPFSVLAPVILLLAAIGAYSLRNLIVDVWVMFIAGIVGYFLRSRGYSMAGIVLGLILGGLAESAFVKTMQMFDYDLLAFLDRPVAATLLFCAVVAFVLSCKVQNADRRLRRTRPQAHRLRYNEPPV